MIDSCLGSVGSQDHDHIRPFGSIGDGQHFEAGSLGLLDRPAARRQTDAYVDARVFKVQRMGMALGSIANNGNFFRLDQRKIGILVVISLGH